MKSTWTSVNLLPTSPGKVIQKHSPRDPMQIDKLDRNCLVSSKRKRNLNSVSPSGQGSSSPRIPGRHRHHMHRLLYKITFSTSCPFNVPSFSLFGISDDEILDVRFCNQVLAFSRVYATCNAPIFNEALTLPAPQPLATPTPPEIYSQQSHAFHTFLNHGKIQTKDIKLIKCNPINKK